jgi:hypothetical protein
MTAYTKTLTASSKLTPKVIFPGLKAGISIFYSNGGSPEGWTEETAKLKLSLNDSIAGRTRILEFHVSNQKNSKEDNYPQYRRVKVIEKRTGVLVFKGRVEISEPYYDDKYGQMLKVVARDYSAELFERKVNSNYGTGTCTNLAGVCKNSPVSFSAETKTITVSTVGTFTVVIPTCCTAVVTSGTTTVSGSPVSLSAGTSTITTSGIPGTFTITMTGCKRSVLIKQIVDDYTSNVAPHAIDTATYIEASGSSQTIARNFTNSGRQPINIIEEFAKEDSWTDTTWAAVWASENIPVSWINDTTNSNSGNSHIFYDTTYSHVYFGQNNPFIGILFTVTGHASYTNMVWQYWNGSSWAALTTTLAANFDDDTTSVKWSIPTDWSSKAFSNVDPISAAPPDTTSRYWIRYSSSHPMSPASISYASCICGYGYDYYIDDNQKFHYFRRGSTPSGGALTSGLKVSLRDAAGLYTKKISRDYNISEQPKEIQTRVTCKGSSSTGDAISYTATDATAEASYGIIKEKIEYVWGKDMSSSELTTYCTNRATALLTETSGTIQRGDVTIAKYPAFTRGSTSIVRAGDNIRAVIAPKGINEDFLVLGITYEEPDGFSKMELVSNVAGRSYSPLDDTSQIKSLKSGDDITIQTARINDLIVNNAQIATCSIDKLTVGTLDVSGTLGDGEWTTGVDNRVAFDTNGISGISKYTLLMGWYGDLTADGSLNTSYVWFQKFTCVTSGTIGIVKANCGGAGNIKLCLYSDAGGAPNSLLAYTGALSIISGWNELDFSGATGPKTVTAGTNYWLGFQTATAGVGYKTVSGGYAVAYKTHTYADAFDDPISGTSTDATKVPLIGAYEDLEQTQFYLSSEDGSVLATAGHITLDGDGLTIYDSANDYSYLKFMSPNTNRSCRFFWEDDTSFDIICDYDLIVGSYHDLYLSSTNDVVIEAANIIDAHSAVYLVIPQVSGVPGSSEDGAMVYDTAQKRIRVYDSSGATWRYVKWTSDA